jgi:hypothetical protein
VEAPLAPTAAPAAARASTGALAGGSGYGVPIAPAALPRPVVGWLEVPATASVGRPPRVTVRVDEPGVATVAVRVTVTGLSTRQAVIVVRLGWVRTGRLLRVRWPARARLAAGSYHVSITAHDRNHGSLLRRAHSSGVASLLVGTPASAAPPALAPPVAGGLPPLLGIPTPAETAAAGAQFPVAGPHSFGGPENRFGAPRAGHIHHGQDVVTAEGTPIVAPLGGSILTASYQATGAGYYAAEQTATGLDFMFAHCKPGTLAVATGEPVTVGQLLCQAGQTGDATTPHLHFEVWVRGWQAPGGQPIDPLPYLLAWDHSAPAAP